jgi:hypothetical protein
MLSPQPGTLLSLSLWDEGIFLAMDRGRGEHENDAEKLVRSGPQTIPACTANPC